MVSVQKLNDQKFLISLKPNSSLIGVNRIIFISSISIVCGGIALIFFFFGATLILPFAGLELGILFTAFYLSFKWSDKKEKIFISQDLVTIEKGSNYAEYKWQEFRSFTSFQVSKDRRDLLKLSFRSKGEDIEVGSFLNEDDKNVLIEELTQIIDTLNLDSFSNPEL